MMPRAVVGRAHAGQVCPSYQVLRFDNALRRILYNPARMFGPYVRPGMTVMDVGCGAGFNCLGLARLVGDTSEVITSHSAMLHGVA